MIWGGGNPVALASSTYCRFTSARLAPVPVRIKAGGDAPSRRHSRHPSRPRRRRDDWDVGNPVALASSTYCRFTSARLAPAPVRIKAGGDAPSRRHSRHPSQDQSRWGCPLPPSFSAPQSGSKQVGMPPPAVILGTPVVHAEGGTTGVSGIQWLLQVAPTVVSLQLVLLQPPSESKKGGAPPSRRHSRHPSRPACGGDDWGAENDGGRG